MCMQKLLLYDESVCVWRANVTKLVCVLGADVFIIDINLFKKLEWNCCRIAKLLNSYIWLFVCSALVLNAVSDHPTQLAWAAVLFQLLKLKSKWINNQNTSTPTSTSSNSQSQNTTSHSNTTNNNNTNTSYPPHKYKQ